jgi:hypothetical protein
MNGAMAALDVRWRFSPGPQIECLEEESASKP